jgi:PD-(D/E)XK nuclease family transposase/Helicobacter pylori protein of unknown function (DUF874)
MYVASLNLDLFFKKVFSNKRIAKKFLQDLLGITITEIKLLSVENKLTDDAITVKFDFRCKIHGEYIVIEMQQKYKVDVVKRFYLYHTVSTALQLETLKPVEVLKPNGETYIEKNYSGLKPVYTIIWMVDDMLGFDDDYIAYTTLPEAANSFIADNDLWQQPLENILAERKKTLKILENDTKGLDFFTKNRLIYVFQKNIIKNNKIKLPYFKWFDLANKSRNFNNKEEDFAHLKEDKDMEEVIKRIRKDKLSTEEFNYVSDIHSWDIYVVRLEQEHKKKMERQKKRLEKINFEIEQKKQIAEQEKQKAEQEKQKAEQEKQKAEQEKQKLVKLLLVQGVTIEAIADTLELTIEQTKDLVESVQNNKL